MISSLMLALALQAAPLLTEDQPVVLECTIDYSNENFFLFINPQTKKLAHASRSEISAHTVGYNLTEHEILYSFLGSDGLTRSYGLSRKSLGLVGSVKNGDVAVTGGYGGCSVISLLGTPP